MRHEIKLWFSNKMETQNKQMDGKHNNYTDIQSYGDRIGDGICQKTTHKYI